MQEPGEFGRRKKEEAARQVRFMSAINGSPFPEKSKINSGTPTEKVLEA